MKKLVVFAIVIAAVVFGAPKLKELMSGSKAAPKAEKRVNAMLQAWSLGGTSSSLEAQTAACQFAEGAKMCVDRDAVGAASRSTHIFAPSAN